MLGHHVRWAGKSLYASITRLATLPLCHFATMSTTNIMHGSGRAPSSPGSGVGTGVGAGAGSGSATAARLSSERSKEELELAERLIEHSQGIQSSARESHTAGPSTAPAVEHYQAIPSSSIPKANDRSSPGSADGEAYGGIEGDDQMQLSDDGSATSAQQMSLPSIHELTWVKQRKPFNTGMGGAGQVCRYVLALSQ